MGNVFRKRKRQKAEYISSTLEASSPTMEPDAAKKPATEPVKDEKKLDPADFTFSERTDEVLIKEPGSINGQMFRIEDCKNCDIFILDHTAQVMIDDCVNCRIFVGPCESSVFFRDCSDCKFVLACQQLRTKDSKNIDLLLFAGTQPTIENTTELRLGCFQFSYFSLLQQFSSAGLSVWNNKWSTVYDFHDSAAQGQPNAHWKYIPDDTKLWDLLDLKKLSENSEIKLEELEGESTVPKTWSSTGDRDHFVLCNLHSTACSVLTQVHDTAKLVQTQQIKLRDDQVTKLLGKGNVLKQKQGGLIGLAFSGQSDVFSKLASTFGPEELFVSENAAEDARMFLEDFKLNDQI